MDIGLWPREMGFPMARRLFEAKHRTHRVRQRKEAVDKLVALGAQAASSPKDVPPRRDRAGEPAVAVRLRLTSRPARAGPSRQARRRFVDLSTVGSHMRCDLDALAKRNIVQLDSPVSVASAAPKRRTLA